MSDVMTCCAEERKIRDQLSYMMDCPAGLFTVCELSCLMDWSARLAWTDSDVQEIESFYRRTVDKLKTMAKLGELP